MSEHSNLDIIRVIQANGGRGVSMARVILGLQGELTDSRQGILDCQTQITALKAQDEIHWKTRRSLLKDRDEAHAAIRALKGKAIHLDNGYRYCVLCNSAPAHRAEDVQHNPQCPIPKHAPAIRRAMGEGK